MDPNLPKEPTDPSVPIDVCVGPFDSTQPTGASTQQRAPGVRRYGTSGHIHRMQGILAGRGLPTLPTGARYVSRFRPQPVSDIPPEEVREVPSTSVRMITRYSNDRPLASGWYVSTPDANCQTVTIGPYAYSADFESDREIFAAQGCHISDHEVGTGTLSQVFAGYYEIPALESDPEEKDVLKIPFAVKYIDSDLSDNSGEGVTDREMYQKEKYVLNKVNHPNIVRMIETKNMGNPQRMAFRMKNDQGQYEYYNCHPRVYIFMELAQFGSLDGLFKALKRNNERIHVYQCLKFMYELLSAVQYLHSIDIIHGDIHSGNVLVFNDSHEDDPNPDLSVKMTDFGDCLVYDSNHCWFPKVQLMGKAENIRKDVQALVKVFEKLYANSECSKYEPRLGLRNWITQLNACHTISDDIVGQFRRLFGGHLFRRRKWKKPSLYRHWKRH